MSADIEHLTAALADRYRVERELGQGGMATVYLAEDLKHRRRVAIKVLRPELAQVLGAERFLREIELVAGLHHPHILPLYDSGEAAGFLYYVMPLVEGESLRAKIDREGQLPIDEALRYAREVADALSYAHARGVVHRDIKPDNIMIESEHAVVADFGIAKAVASAGDATALTGTGMSVGTPAYMSPEQAAGDRDVDGRSDLYSLGCVLFEMLAGQPPFTGKTIDILVRQHIMTPPPPVTQFRPAVPAPVADALARALAKAPADRFNPVGQFSSALGSGGSSSTTGAPVAIHPEVKRARRTGLVVGGAFAILLLLAAGFMFMSRGGRAESSGLRTIAVLPFRNIGADSSTESFVLGMHGEIVTQLTGLGSMQVASQSSAAQYQETSKSNREIAGELGVEHLLTGSVQRSGGQVRVTVALEDAGRNRQLWAQSYERALTAENLFAMQADIARQVTSALSIQLTSEQEAAISRPVTKNLAALDLYYRAQALWAGRDFTNETTTVRLLEEAVRIDSSFVRAWGLLAQARSWLLRVGKGVDTMPAWTAVLRARELDPASLDVALAAGYYSYYARADYPGALASLEEADRLMPNSVEILSVRSLLLRRLGRWDEAVQVLEKAARLDRRNSGVLANLGETYLFLRRWDDAERIIDQGLALTPSSANLILAKLQLLREGRGDTAGARVVVENSRALLSPGVASVAFGRLHMVRRDYPAAITTAGQWPADTYTGAGGSKYVMLALIANAQGDQPATRSSIDSAIKVGNLHLAIRRRRGPDDPFGGQAIVELNIATAYALAGDSSRAVMMAETAARRFSPERDRLEGTEHLRWLAVVYMLTNRKADAIATLKAMLAVPSTMTVNDLRLNFLWDPLRNEPAFQQLVPET
jgi:TolB-like protein/tRNA A-37 threonylcarbamoyl transferase component Bud32